MSTGDELRAAVSARRDLGPDFEDAVVESFLDKMGKEIDRRVDERVAATTGKGKKAAKSGGPGHGQRLALAIVSLSLGTLATLALTATQGNPWVIPAIWFAIVLVNVVFTTVGRD
ncbi:hypothetical protein [Nonomuraea cavernae]|uniref:Integral membrane protein n=1 Tax=Nonomuraea cavernae TaxID=2045107 RepID=A0A918DMJ5_9ACTN|nr:hypothetical protein [Nonomuraea cavernae]MCA2186978.1 hypothetical protein [Nonomuraea cavernae]GGO75123.1 hypothetical protein GCM10012289_49420 [Nonomuraea cavernae]